MGVHKKTRIIIEDIDDIIQRLKSGNSTMDSIAAEYHTGYGVLKKVLLTRFNEEQYRQLARLNQGGKRNIKKVRAVFRDAKKMVQRLRNNQATMRGLAKEYGTSYLTIKKAVLTKLSRKEYQQLSIGKNRKQINNISIEIDSIVQKLRSVELSMVQAAKRYGTTYMTLKRLVVNRVGVQEYERIVSNIYSVRAGSRATSNRPAGFNAQKAVESHRQRYEPKWVCTGCFSEYSACPDTACPKCLHLRFEKIFLQAA